MTSKQLTKVTVTLAAGSDYNTLPEKLRRCILFKIQHGTDSDGKTHIHGASGQEQVSPPRTPHSRKHAALLRNWGVPAKEGQSGKNGSTRVQIQTDFKMSTF